MPDTIRYNNHLDLIVITSCNINEGRGPRVLRFGEYITIINQKVQGKMCHLCICISGKSVVTTRNGDKTVASLKPGDYVLTLGKRDLAPKFSRFCTFLHREAEMTAEFVVLTLSNGKKLTLSEDHLLFSVDSEGKAVAKRTKQLKKGDHLIFHEGGTGNASSVSSQIIEMGKELVTGFYSPLTTSGTLLANGILVTSFARTDNFRLAMAATAPLRWATLGERNDGIHPYAKGLRKIRETLDFRGNGAFKCQN